MLCDRFAAGKVQALKHNPAPPSRNKACWPSSVHPSQINHQFSTGFSYVQCELGSKKALEFTSDDLAFPRAHSALLGLVLVVPGGSKTVAFASFPWSILYILSPSWEGDLQDGQNR